MRYCFTSYLRFRLKSFHCLFVILLIGSRGSDRGYTIMADGSPQEKEISSEKKIDINISERNESARRIRLQRQLVLQRKTWKKVFDEIKLSALPSKSINRTRVKSKAKGKISNSNRPLPMNRFDGFESWEKRLLQWKEDVEVYLDQALQSSVTGETEDYPFATFGVPILPEESGNTISKTNDDKYDQHELTPTLMLKPTPIRRGEAVVPHTDLADKTKHIWIVTTAALPWMTGTAVNPLLRAAYLCEAGYDKITIMLPWLERSKDQERLYGKEDKFPDQKSQENYIRNWLRNTALLSIAAEKLQIMWYIGWQEVLENSVYAMGDITALIPDDEADICILEEPEHLNWYRAPGESWTKKFKHAVGIVHTNYFVYATEQPAAFIRAPAMKLLCSWMCRAHCHRVIKLSATLNQFAPEKELVENVHGVRREFIDIGKDVRKRLSKVDSIFAADAQPSVYFIGKMLWSKGLGSLMELIKYAEENANLRLESFDMYGGGPNRDEAEARAKKLGINMTFHGPIDHAKLGMTHKIFINPSLSEVLCTTVAEALAMGKFVILPNHPSNDFFIQFPNCLPYSSKEEFVGNLYYAMTHSPVPMTKDLLYILSWEAATNRLIAAGSISVAESDAREALASSEVGMEISLPPIISDDERAKKIIRPIHKTRERYRHFRSKLYLEVQQSKVLPPQFQKRLLYELDKKLDLDLDKILSEPKLRLQLSPAELDRRLLEFYDNMSKSPSGDILRIIGGGANVGAQNLFLKRQARKKKIEDNKKKGFGTALLSDDIIADFIEDDDSSPVDMVKRALDRNFKTNVRDNINKRHHENETERGQSRSPGSSSTELKYSIPAKSSENKFSGIHFSSHLRPNTRYGESRFPKMNLVSPQYCQPSTVCRRVNSILL